MKPNASTITRITLLLVPLAMLPCVSLAAPTSRGAGSPDGKPPNAPLMSLMDRFVAAEKANPTPAPPPAQPLKPNAKPPPPTPVPVPDPLPGRGMAEHPMLYIGEWCKGLFVIHDGKIIWTYAAGGKGEYEDAWMLCNGNTIVCTQVGRGQPPQLFEVTRDKKVVWMLRNWTDLGGSTAVQILDDPGIPENPGEFEH